MNTTRIGIDLAKSVFEVAVSRTPGRVERRQRLARGRMHEYFARCEPAEILMEACGSAHHWGRELQAMGHRVSLLHPGDVARYRDGNKTDRADAKALLEAARNEAIDCVPVKSIDQQAIGALHRLRQGYLQTRTARINAVRGHLREFGVTTPMGPRRVLPEVSSEPDDLRTWALEIERRSGHNVAAVALANKLARVCWRVWRDQRPFQRRLAA